MKKKSFLLLVFFIGIFSCNWVKAQEEETNNKRNSSSNLTTLQPIAVTLGGNFIVNGSFPSSALTRVDQFVTQLYTMGSAQARAALQDYWAVRLIEQGLSQYPLRGIALKRIDGTTKNIDLLKFRLTGDFQYNPYLKNDDVLVFPDYDVNRDIVDISGAVNKPAKFQYVEGDRISDAILFAGGLNPAYDNVNQAMISKLDYTGTKETKTIVNIADNTELQRGDRIKILADENQKKGFKALVMGEVKNPGFAYLRKDGTPLKNVIEDLGGFTEKADLRRSEIIRQFTSNELFRRQEYYKQYFTDKNLDLGLEKPIKDRILEDELSMSRSSNLIMEDSLYFSIDNTLRAIKNEHLVDFEEIADPESQAANFLVRDGDVILIPQKFDYIYLFGQVPRTGYVTFEEGKDYRYYIQKAGGLSETARNYDEVVIIKGSTRNWVIDNKEKEVLEPGDFIYVPKEIPRSFNFYLQRVSSIAGIVGSVATIILLLVQLGK